MTLRVIALAASKGGCSKSTLATALAVQAVKEGGKVALLDWEPQGSVTLWWVMRQKPANPKLIRDAGDPVEAIAELGDDFDWAFVDTPPSGMDEIGRAIEAADFVLVPVQASAFDLAAVRPVVAACGAARKALRLCADPRAPAARSPQQLGRRPPQEDGAGADRARPGAHGLRLGARPGKDRARASRQQAGQGSASGGRGAVGCRQGSRDKGEVPMIGGTDIDDLDAQLAAAYQADREVADMGKPSVRRAREKQHALSPDDGRRKRKTGRTAQFNVKMKPDLKRQIVNVSRDRGIAISALAEQAFVALLAKLAREAQP